MVYTKCCDIRPAAMLVYDVYVLTVIIYERRKWVAYKGVGMCGGGGCVGERGMWWKGKGGCVKGGCVVEGRGMCGWGGGLCGGGGWGERGWRKELKLKIQHFVDDIRV